VRRLWVSGAPSMIEGEVRRRNRGGASHAIMTRPAATKSRATSVPVAAVTTPMATVMAQRRTSFSLVSRASFTATTASTAITAGAMP